MFHHIARRWPHTKDTIQDTRRVSWHYLHDYLIPQMRNDAQTRSIVPIIHFNAGSFWGFIPRKDFNIWKSLWDGAYRCRPAKKEFRRQTLTLEERLWLSIYGMQTPQSPLIATATLLQLMHIPYFLVNRCGEVVPHMVWILRGESPRRKNLMHAGIYCANADLYFATSSILPLD